jgi:hypothetical protein
MISKLTPEQENKIPEYLNYWLKVGIRTETIDRDKAKKAMNFLYTKILKMKEPKQYLFLDSPMACQLVLNSSNQLDNQLENQLRNQLWNQLWSQLGIQLGNQLWNQLENQLGNQLRNQLWNQKMFFTYETKTNWTQTTYWYYSFILNEIFPEKKKDFGLFLDYLEHSKHYHHIYLSPDIAILSDFPKTVNVNLNGQLDNSEGKALEYRDGYGFYAQNGATANSPLELELL